MKILKAKILVDRSNGATTYIYPSVWLEHKEKFPFVVYANDRTDDVVGGDQTYQWVYPCVPDNLAEGMLVSGITYATQAEFIAFSDKHYPIREVIQDEPKVVAILAKVARNEVLTQIEKDALDPANPEPGIGKTKRMIDLAIEYGVTW